MRQLFTLKSRNRLPVFIICFLAQSVAFAQSSPKLLSDISENEIVLTGERHTIPGRYRTLHLDKPAAQQFFSAAQAESPAVIKSSNVIFEMPMPDGSSSHFRIWETPVMDPALAAQFPDIKTYAGQGIDNPNASIRLDLTPLGFHAMVLSPEGSVWIDPYCANNVENYICYNKRDLIPVNNFICEAENAKRANVDDFRTIIPDDLYTQKVAGAQLRTYRLALACTGEYAATKGGTVAGAMAGIVTSMNRVDGVYETEVAIRMTLISNNSSIVYTNSSTDPYTNGNGGTMLGQNQTTCTNVIGSANYDIGHVFSTGGGGVAYLGCVCSSSNKAGGVTGSTNPVGDAYDIDYVAHEMGHQFGGNHTFNSTTGSCGGGNRSSGAAFEPGSGITIMAYAGICGADDLDAHSIAYFHAWSFDEIVTYSTTGNGNTCATTTVSGNNPPNVTSQGANYTIPISTPFVLTGAATDADGDPLTYSWEEMDLGTAGGLNVQSTTAPQFRPFSPVTSPSRTFPKLSSIISNTASVGEWLPNQARSLKFRLTARDNRMGGGGVMHPDVNVTITVANTGGAFAVTAPNTAVTWAGGSTQAVTWNVSGTSGSPISCANVMISLSTDGGNTFPTVIAASTANDGSENITVPNIATTTARIKVEAVGNIFFDMGNVNFTITGASGLTAISTSAISPLAYCAGASVNVPFTTTGSANAGNLFKALLSNASGSFASPDTIGSLSGTGAGTIVSTIPANKPTGSGYRIKVISTNPVITGSDNGSNISISAQVAAAGSINTAFTSFCANIPITFTTGAIANATTYTWAATGGAVVSSGQGTQTAVIAFPNNISSSTVSLVGSNTNCTGAASNLVVTIMSTPNAPTANNAVGCSGVPITLTGNPAGGTFSVPNPYTGSSTTFTYNIANGNGCNTNSSPANITVNSSPAPSISGTTAFCVGSSTNFSASAGFTNYNWSTGATTQSININAAGTFTVTVTNANGCTGSASRTSTVNSNPTTSISGSLSFCSGSSTTLNAGAGFSGYNWSTGATTQTINVSTASTFTVTVTNASGCTGSNAATTTISSSLSPVISGNTPVCSGNTINLNAGAGFSTYTWSTGATTQTINVNTAATFTVTVTNASGCTGSTSATTTVNVNPSTSIFGNTSFCSGGSTNLSAGAGFNSYSWSTGATTQVILTSVGGTFTVTVTNASGCTASASAAITVNPLPSVSFSGLAASYNVNAASATLTGSPSGGTFSGAGVSGNTFSPSAAGVGGPYTISYSYTDGNGCTNSSSQQTTVTNCTLAATPGTISSSGGSAKVCPGDSRTYKVALVSGATSYTWTAPAGGVITSGAGTRTVIISYNSGFTANDTLRVTANNACGSSAERKLNIVRNTPAIPGTITGLSYGVCNMANLLYSVTAVTGMTYSWSLSVTTASINSGQGTNGISASYTSAFSTGVLGVTATNACGVGPSRNLTVRAIPATPTSISGSATACANQSGVPYSISAISSAVNYTWLVPAGATIFDGTVTSSGTTLVTTSPSVSVNFGSTSGAVKVRANNACGSGSYRSLTVSFNCRQLNPIGGFDFSLAPNPAQNATEVAFIADKESKYVIIVMDLTGRIVILNTGTSIAGENRFSINLENISKGIYMMRVINGDEQSFKKLQVN